MKTIIKYPRDRAKERDIFLESVKKSMVRVLKQAVQQELNDAVRDFERRLQHKLVYECATLAATMEAEYVGDGKTLRITFRAEEDDHG